MPLTQYTCPTTVPTAGQRNDIEHCIFRCPHPCVAPPLLEAIYNAERKNHHVGCYISASMLTTKCYRQTQFERYADFAESVRRRFWPFRGTLAHRIIEDAGELSARAGYMQEIRMGVDLTYPEHRAPQLDDAGVWTGEWLDEPLVIQMGGTCDCYNPYTRVLWDFKTMADAKAKMFYAGEKDDADWVAQLNVYRYLISQTRITDAHRESFRAHGLPELAGEYFPAPEELVIQGIAMMEIPRSGAKYEPQRSRQHYDVPPIAVWPLEETERFVREGAYEWYRYLILREPAPVAPPQNAWVCKSCPFNGEVVDGQPCFPSAERAAEEEADRVRAMQDRAEQGEDPAEADGYLPPTSPSAEKPKRPRKPRAPRKARALPVVDETPPDRYPWEQD